MSNQALIRQLRDLDPLSEPTTTKQIGCEAAEEIERLMRALVERNERILTAERQASAKNRALAGLLNCDALMTGDPDHDAQVWAEAESNARMALENGPAGLADAPNDPAASDLSSLRKGAEVAVKDSARDLLSHLELYEFSERDPSGELNEKMADLKAALEDGDG